METPIAQVYDDFGRRWAHDTSPLYEEWARGIAGDPELLQLLTALPRAKQQPNLVFASARWAGSPLAPYPQWREWVLAHADDVLDVALAHTVQTNEPNRCATLLPVLSRIEGPVALLEVGAAAGLCLYPDRYSVEYSTPDGTIEVHPDDGPSAVTLSCRLDDTSSVPARMPEVLWRRGIDLAPIDPAHSPSVKWLETLIWPGPAHDARVARLRAAARIAASDPPVIVQGDLLERLTDAAGEAPADATLVVYHSAVLLYLDAHQRRRFFELVSGLGASVGRKTLWLSNETLGTLPEIDAQVPAATDTSHRFVQTRDGVAIALAGQHGAVYETNPFRP